jgi:hypothetical protein
MTWVGTKGFSRRPVVVVEDHLYHITQLLETLDGSAEGREIVPQLAVVCLDRPGPDTERSVAGWLASHPALAVAAAIDSAALSHPRFSPLPPEAFTEAPRLAGFLTRTVRAGGLLISDVQLSTLPFIPADRWWESIYLASSVRGLFAAHPPSCAFLSNKRGYAATFGKELMDAGFDPRDVMDKGELERVVVPTLAQALRRGFPLALEVLSEGERLPEVRLRREAADRDEAERELDLLLAETGDGTVELGGRRIGGRRLALKAGSPEARTWRELFADRFAAGSGVPVVAIGERLASAGAGRGEVTNLAARHLHTLRGRLAAGEGDGTIVTAHHAYRLSERLRIGRAAPRTEAAGRS